MKKNFIYSLFAMAALLFATSCQNEELFGGANVDTDVVTYSITTQDLGTRTGGSTTEKEQAGRGKYADKLYYGVYEFVNSEWSLVENISATTLEGSKKQPIAIANGHAIVNIQLAKQKNYSIIFWAQNDNNMVDINWANRSMSLKKSGLLANQEDYDAFWAYDEINLKGALDRKVSLVRPFAQINIGASDFQAVKDASVNINKSAIVVKKVPTTMDLTNGNVTEYAETSSVSLGLNNILDHANWTFPKAGCEFLTLGYILAEAEQTLVDIDLTYTDTEGGNYSNAFTNVPVRRNYRTNIYGQLLTGNAGYEVEITPDFGGDNDIEVWDGQSTDEPAIDETNKTVTIATGNQLAWLAASVNGTLSAGTRAGETTANSYAGWTILLDENIDLGGEEWTPIGLKGKRFMGTFDGQGHTISNFQISTAANGAQAALFGDVNRAVIKNFTIDNANVLYPANYSGDFYGAAVVSQVYMVTLQNITVKNSTIQGNNKVAAILAQDADGAAMVIEDCHVEGCTIETKNDADGGNAAGIVGSVQGSNNTKSLKNCSVRNTTFNVLNSADAGKRSNAQMVATIIATAETVVTLENCVVEGNTFNQSGVENFVSQYDGIFVGGARTEETGTVIINGKPYGAVKINDEYYKTVEEALAKAKAGDVIYVGAGNFVIPASVTTSPAGTITFEGYGNTSVLSFNSKAGGADGGLNSYAEGMDLVFKNLKVVSPNTGSAYTGGFGRVKSVLFDNCTYEGQYRSHGYTKFNECTIDPQTSYIYTDRVNVDFVGCTFNCSEGKGIQVYGDNSGWESVINITNCQFTAAKVGNTYNGKPVTAIDINSTGAKFTVNITNTTATGFGTGLFSNSQLWNIKGGEANVTVTIDNNLAYPFFTQDETTGEYNVSTVKGLKDVLTSAGLAGAGNSTINITSDIDLTGVEWTPINVDGYHGADTVTIEGNGAVITGLTAPLFAGGFAGGSGIVIKNLTIDASTIVSTNSNGSGAFVESSDSQAKIYLENCHLTNSSVTGSRTGGLVGWTSGYSNVNDGPVKTYVTLRNCSVENCTITGSGSVGGLNGHAGASDWTYTTIENCSVTNCDLISTDAGGWRVGVAVGTANIGEVTITNLTESGNTLTQTGKEAPTTGFKRNYYGRFVGGSTGKLIIDGCAIANTQASLLTALADEEVATVYLGEGKYVPSLYNNDIPTRESLTIIGAGADKTQFAYTGSHQAGQFSLTGFDRITIRDCEILKRENVKDWGMVVFGSSNNANGVYTIENCTFNGVGTQGIYINENTSGAVYNILDCTFNGDFGNEGAITIQNNTDVNHTVNVNGCTFNDIPESSHKIYIVGNYAGWTLNADNQSDVYWSHANPNI